MTETKLTRNNNRVLLVILGVAAFLRFSAIGFGLPWLPSYDEFQVVERALAMGQGTPDPQLYTWPGGPVFYLNFASFGLIFVLGKLFGAFASAKAFAVWYMSDPSLLYLVSRGFSALWGTLACLAAYHMARRLANRNAGLWAAAAVAITPEWLITSVVTLPDALAAFLVALCLAACLRAQLRNSPRALLMAGVWLGLAAGTKYHTWIACVPLILTALYLPHGKRIKTLAGALSLVIMSFFVLNPFILLNWGTASANMDLMRWRIYESTPTLFHYDLLFFTALPLALSIPLLVLALLGMVRACTRHRPGDLILLSFLVPFLLMVGLTMSPPKFVLPALVPFIALGGAALADIVRLSKHKIVAIAVFFLLFLAFPLWQAMGWAWGKWQEEPRYEAARVVLSRLEPGRTIVMDQLPPDTLTLPLAADIESLKRHVDEVTGAKGWTKARVESPEYPFGRVAVPVFTTDMSIDRFHSFITNPQTQFMAIVDPDDARWRAELNKEITAESYIQDTTYREEVRKTAVVCGWQKLVDLDGRAEGRGYRVEVWEIIHQGFVK